ncbi:hypothetical protein RIF29_15683 [Crotalaria pallida]|uniref:Uncharacterized protein n=1 Tax=Crotalaria pallida TaxID=3830 RepID=A0AAN9FDJ5_CROPI
MVVLEYAKVKIFKGKPVIQNTLYASRLLINSDVPEVIEIKDSCSELVASFCEGVDGDEYPPIFKSLVGRKMLFKVANPCAGASHDNEAIKVRGVCDDATIISLYELPGADLSPEDAFPLSTAPPSIDLTCDQTEGFEDDIGLSTSILVSPNSNESVSSKILSPATSIGLQTPPANRKRKLDDLYADSYPTPCATRRQSNKASKK